jgi:hypothetical protein
MVLGVNHNMHGATAWEWCAWQQSGLQVCVAGGQGSGHQLQHSALKTMALAGKQHPDALCSCVLLPIVHH